MKDLKIEDTVVLLDTSRSMMRSDFKPSRLYVQIKATKQFIEKKFSIDPKDRIALATFGKITRKLNDFTYDRAKLLDSLRKVQISGKGNLRDGIAFSLQILVAEMRKIGGKVPRILIFSDNKLQIENKIDKIIDLAKGLGVFIDSCQLGRPQDFQKNILKKISQTTKGEYGYFNNSKALLNAGKAFASKKDTNKTADYFSPEKKDKIPPLVSEIAVPLRRPNVMEIRLMMSEAGRNQETCQICHSKKAPITGADFFSEGRFCPSCDRPMHLTCAGLWAKKTEYKDNVFRCPFCYFLLSLPYSVMSLIEDKTDEDQEIKLMEDEDLNETKMELVPEDKVKNIDASCSYCNSIFLGDYDVYQCENCGSYYHKPCLEKMYNEIHSCRYCGARISHQ